MHFSYSLAPDELEAESISKIDGKAMARPMDLVPNIGYTSNCTEKDCRSATINEKD